jgi:glycosyltransferase involved in cell wall biosynthesis
MIASSYPRFPGDAIATFMEPMATGVAALGHDVHLVAPWHPDWRRPEVEGGVRFHLYRYAPARALNVFGYAGALRADVRLKGAALAAAPLAVAAGRRCLRRVARDARATIVHAHWVVPSGVMAASTTDRPLVISLHGSDVFVAERHRAVGAAARYAFARAAWITACSQDLRDRAARFGARPDRMTVIPYGVDGDRFQPDAGLRAQVRARMGVGNGSPVVLAFGRLVKKKGFEYLIDAAPALLRRHADLRIVIAGEGDLTGALRARAAAAGVGAHVVMPGVVSQHEIPGWLAAADVAVVPSVHDEAGNVDGLPNTVLEIMASGTPLVATPVGGIGQVATDGETARLVPERDAPALASAIDDLLARAELRQAMGARARARVTREYGWTRVAEQFSDIYDRVTGGHGH